MCSWMAKTIGSVDNTFGASGRLKGGFVWYGKSSFWPWGHSYPWLHGDRSPLKTSLSFLYRFQAKARPCQCNRREHFVKKVALTIAAMQTSSRINQLPSIFHLLRVNVSCVILQIRTTSQLTGRRTRKLHSAPPATRLSHWATLIRLAMV